MEKSNPENSIPQKSGSQESRSETSCVEKVVQSRALDASVLRLVDANLNRCREGLRVLEDTARFLWNDGERYLALRALRHKLDALTRAHYAQLVQSRESEGDSGRPIAEGKRESAQAVVYANFRRCEESLRVLEEYSKLFDNSWSAEFKAVRFAVYTLEKKTVQDLEK